MVESYFKKVCDVAHLESIIMSKQKVCKFHDFIVVYLSDECPVCKQNKSMCRSCKTILELKDLQEARERGDIP